jgi:thiamine-phosphate pyrophosphorylase
MELPEALRLIVITDHDLARPRLVDDVVLASLKGGARAIQLRDKGASARSLLEQAVQLRALTREWGACLFINDRFDVALASEADGVHLGPDDLPVAVVRAAAPSGFLIGASTDEPDVAKRLRDEGADYIGCGAVFPTSTKRDAGEVIGVQGLARVAEAVEVPVVGIGGVTPEGATQIAEGSRAAGVAVISAVMAAEKPTTMVQRLLEPFGGPPNDPKRQRGG